MVAKVIQLRFRQIFRFVRETGLILLVALLVSAGFIFQAIEQVRALDERYIAGLGLIIVAGLHFTRKDLRFLAKITSRPLQWRQILLAESFLLLSPAILLFLFAGPQKNGLALALCPLIAWECLDSITLKCRKKLND